MMQQDERLFLAAAFEPAVDHTPTRLRLVDLSCDALPGEDVLPEPGCGRLVPRRVGGVDLDDLTEQLASLFFNRGPVYIREGLGLRRERTNEDEREDKEQRQPNTAVRASRRLGLSHHTGGPILCV